MKMKAGFTLIELLVVIVIIGILAALTLGAGRVLQEKGRKSRAEGEIAALDTALARYKVDTGDYPDVGSAAGNLTSGGNIYNRDSKSYVGDTASVTGRDANGRGQVTGGSGGCYLFACLMGRRTFSETETIAYPQYIEVRASQVALRADGEDYFIDPYKNPYGYYYDSTGETQVSGATRTQKSLFNAVEPDIWSVGPTGDDTTEPSSDPSNTKGYAVYLKWIKNWAVNQ